MPTVQETMTIGKPSLQGEREHGDVQHQVGERRCVCEEARKQKARRQTNKQKGNKAKKARCSCVTPPQLPCRPAPLAPRPAPYKLNCTHGWR